MFGATAASTLLCLLAAGGALAVPGKSENSNNVNHDVSPPLSSLAPAAAPDGKEKKEKEPKKGLPVPAPSAADPVVQSVPGAAAAPALGAGFEGIGQGFSGPAGTFSVSGVPPDPNAAVGPNHIVEIVNTSFAVFDKSGTVLYGPAPTNTLWSGFGGGCQSNNDGDGTVAYDRLADRWIISQFSVSSTPYLQCVAVSTTGDPLGSYARYSFQYANFPDYPKLGVWPDGYYTTFNMFNNSTGSQFFGPEVCAYDRASMLQGLSATQQCFDVGPAYGSLLPADVDGARPPPAGAPNDVVSFATGALELWAFHVDWANPANSTLSGPTAVPAAAFTPACGGAGDCVPQPGTTQKLDSLADRLMYRFAYRNFGDHESLVVTHSVTAGSSVGVRWYELRDPNGSPFVYQQGTYAPDSDNRWMGSAAMDGSGNIALGYSVASSSVYPSIRVTGRLAGDPPGVMTQGESTIVTGGGSQLLYGRWGDYTSMSVDPSDDCTFWYTDEYLAASGAFNWHTRIGSFALPGCGGAAGGSDFSLAANPAGLNVAQGSSGSTTVSTAVVSGSAQTVAFSASGQPAGTTVSFSPASVSAGASSAMTIAVGPAVAGGTYTITVTGTGTSAAHTATVSLTVPPGPIGNGTFETGTLAGWTAAGVRPPVISTTAHGGSYAARIGSSSAFNGSSTLTQTVVVPSGNPTLTFWYQPRCADTIAYDQIQAQLRSTSGATLATILNVCANTATWTQVTYPLAAYAGQTVVLWFNVHDDGYPFDPTYAQIDDVAFGTGPPNDFSIAASPAAVSVVQGASNTSTISTAVTSGSAQTVALSASGLPSGASASFGPASVTAGGSSTLTLSAGSGTPSGNYTVTVTGTGGGVTHSVTIGLTVTPAAGSIVNAGFETGNLSGWTIGGVRAPAISTTAHTGSYSARVGSPTAFNGNSTLTQSVAVPPGATLLTFWYAPRCPDRITYDQIQMQLRSPSGATLASVLNVCSNTGAWTQVSFDVSAYAGQTLVLWFNVHDDGYPFDPTYAYFDDVALT